MVMKKNYYAKVLALTVAASMVSVPAFAEEGDGTAVAAQEQKKEGENEQISKDSEKENKEQTIEEETLVNRVTTQNALEDEPVALAEEDETQSEIAINSAEQIYALARILGGIGTDEDYQLFIPKNDTEGTDDETTSELTNAEKTELKAKLQTAKYELTDNISLSNENGFCGIPDFKGTFDGKNHKITLTIDYSNYYSVTDDVTHSVYRFGGVFRNIEGATKLFEHQYLGRDEARTILQNIAQGKYNDVQVASLITVFLMRNISVEELCGFRDALLEMRVPVDLSEFAPIDIVGTGGDGKNTFNISTAACFTVAGAGIPVVKHGNYGATSVSGASNVMEQHGVKFTSDVDQMRRSMEQCNIAYLHAPLFNPALKAVAPIRKGLAVRTFFNMLGPLVNPVLPTYQLLGVYNLPLLRLYTYTYQESKTKFAVVHSLDGYDEISLTNEFKVATCGNEKIYTPEGLGFARYQDTDLDGGQTPEDAAKIFDNIMNNTATEAQKNVVVINAAFAIQVVRPEKTIEECIALAKESLESGRALATLKKFIELNNK